MRWIQYRWKWMSDGSLHQWRSDSIDDEEVNDILQAVRRQNDNGQFADLVIDEKSKGFVFVFPLFPEDRKKNDILLMIEQT